MTLVNNRLKGRFLIGSMAAENSNLILTMPKRDHLEKCPLSMDSLWANPEIFVGNLVQLQKRSGKAAR